jgi:CheY-like chemotaxis protein
MALHLSGTILVIDDEPSVVRALAGLLRRDGYLVGTASNGRHALAQLSQARAPALPSSCHEHSGPPCGETRT